MTTVLYSLAGVIGMLLLLNGKDHAAYVVCDAVTQIWRFLSEFLRADYRGDRRISAYQLMALVATVYALLLSRLLPDAPFPSSIIEGLRRIWNPSIIIACQILWIGSFIYMGRSQVTGSRISFHVRQDRI